MNFVTYHNADGGPNGDQWLDDVGLVPNFMQNVDITARRVFMYQSQNTDPQTPAEGQIETFNVTSTTENGGPVALNPCTSGGYFDGTDISTFTVPGLDTPNDQSPSQVSAKSVGSGSNQIDPSLVLFSDAAGPNPIASTAVNAGSTPYAGGLFDFTDPQIPSGSFSDILFLTSNDPTAGYVWAETESPGGFGAAGDVPGIVATQVIPLPASMVFLLSALGGLGFLRRRRAAVRA